MSTLVTQPMMQRRPNPTELRSMDSHIQILRRFQKSKEKVPPHSVMKNHPLPPNSQNGIVSFGYVDSSANTFIIL